MDRGRLREVGTPQQIHGRPRSSFTARFVGNNNVFGAVVVSEEPLTLKIGFTSLRCAEADTARVGGETTIVVPAEAFRLVPESREDNILAGKIRLKTFHGPLTRVELEVEGESWVTTLPSSQVVSYAVGDALQLFLPIASCHVLNED